MRSPEEKAAHGEASDHINWHIHDNAARIWPHEDPPAGETHGKVEDEVREPGPGHEVLLGEKVPVER